MTFHKQCRTDLDTDQIALLGSYLKSGFFKTYWDLYPIKYQHNTLNPGITRITKNNFFSWYKSFDLIKHLSLNTNWYTSMDAWMNFRIIFSLLTFKKGNHPSAAEQTDIFFLMQQQLLRSSQQRKRTSHMQVAGSTKSTESQSVLVRCTGSPWLPDNSKRQMAHTPSKVTMHFGGNLSLLVHNRWLSFD